MSFSNSTRGGFALSGILLLAWLGSLGCASTDVQMESEYGGQLPRPDRILITQFATSPDEVKLDWSPTVSGVWKLEGLSTTEEEQKIAHAVAEALAKKLVEKVQKLGLPAELATGPVPDVSGSSGSTIAIVGQFLTINEGNRAERVAIGLGAGRSDVRTAVQVSELFPDGQRLVDRFDIVAKSGRKPGAVETLGVGAAAGNLAVSAAVTAGGTVASEAFGDDVDADAERTAAKIEGALKELFVRQGWIQG